MIYRDFDVEISRSQSRYLVTCRAPDGAEASHRMHWNVTATELDAVFLAMQATRGVKRGSNLLAERTLESFGRKLFNRVFYGDVRALFSASLAKCGEGDALRVRLRLERAPALVNVPWELLFSDRYLATDRRTALVRYLTQPLPVQPQEVDGVLRLVIVTSLPRDEYPIAAERELDQLRSGIENASIGDRLQPTILRNATLDRLHRAVVDIEPQIIHFIGHGQFDPVTGQGMLLFEDSQSNSRRVGGQRFAATIAGLKTKLVVLNACDGAVANGMTPYSGVAQQLIQYGIPSVVAMQLPIGDETAVEFASAFYGWLADGKPLEQVMVEARLALWNTLESLEFAIPVFYLRASSGMLFSGLEPARDRSHVATLWAEPPAPEAMPEAGPAADANRPDAIVAELLAAVTNPPIEQTLPFKLPLVRFGLATAILFAVIAGVVIALAVATDISFPVISDLRYALGLDATNAPAR